MSRVLIVGAGAEVDLGFKSGPRFTQDTFYCQKNSLYKALGSFYEKRLGASRDAFVPVKYEPAFLFNWNGRAFKDLVRNLVRDNSMFVFDELDKPLEEVQEVSKYEPEDFKKLFNRIVVENVDGQPAKDMGGSIPKDSHFGILEQYYSELLDPNAHLVRFWKLVNFYWSAFFSIALPLTDRLYSGEQSYEVARYAYVLSHLDETIHDVFDARQIGKVFDSDCYYSMLRGKFDHVITTNYTPYAAAVINCEDERISWLSGKLSTFERLPDLEFADYSEPGKHIKDDDFIFPYLLCQSPVKPVVSLAQLKEYAKASRALEEADEIVVLGYSFCNEDAHICSMVGESLRSDPGRKLVFFSYCEEEAEFEARDAATDLGKKLRVTETVLEKQIDILPLSSCRSKAFVERCEG